MSKLPSSQCTNCGKVCDDAIEFNSEAHPRPGDITLCIQCCHIMIYAEDMALQDLTEADIAGLKADGHWAYIEEMQFKLAFAKATIGARWN